MSDPQYLVVDADASAARGRIVYAPLGASNDDAIRQAVEDALPGFLSSGGSIHLGNGAPPDLIVGAQVHDVYVDMTTGTLWQLDEGQ